MNTSKRVVMSFLIAAIILFLAMLFWPFVVNNILRPIALVVWLLLRILVLSIHQKYFWYALIVISFILLLRFLPRLQADIPADIRLETNTTMINIGYWRSLLTYNDQDVREDRILKRELTYLLTSLYASKQGTLNSFDIHDALQQGRIPLPENIHAFLFSQEPTVSGGFLKRFFQSTRSTLQKRIRRWTGQEKAEHFQLIDEVLKFIETSLEINNDDTKLSQNEN